MTAQLIGSDIQVVDAKNASLVGITGKVLDETRNTLIVITMGGTVRLSKEQITIRIGQRDIPGQQLLGRPEERIKKSW